MAALGEDMIINIKEEPDDPLLEEQYTNQQFEKSNIDTIDNFSACKDNDNREFVFVKCKTESSDIQDGGASDNEKETGSNTHADIKEFKCKICNKQFLRKMYLTRHMKIHTGIKEFKCIICNKEFLRQKDLKRHSNIHCDLTESKLFECHICNKQFKRKDYLVSHMKTHTGIKDFKCIICYKEYLRKEDLIKHQKLHNGLTEFKCTICDVQFIDKTILKSHMQIHVQDSNCTICNKQFAHKSSLRRHMEHHTSIKEFRDSQDQPVRNIEIKVKNEEQMISQEGNMVIEKEAENSLDEQDTYQDFARSSIGIRDEFPAFESNTRQEFVFVKCEPESSV